MTAPDADPSLPRYLALLWGREPATPRRGPKPTISVRDIGRAAVAVADATGWESVSMKAIAESLGLTTMSLYRYVDGKEDVTEIMVDTAYGPADRALTATGDWRTRIEAWARAAADCMRRRPWLAAIPLHRPPLGPNVLSWTDSGIQAFADTALTGEQKLSALLVVDGFVRHHVRQAAQMGLLEEKPPAEPTYESMLAILADAGSYPSIAAAITSMSSATATATADYFYTEELEFGLRIVLDGLAALIADTSKSRHRPEHRNQG